MSLPCPICESSSEVLFIKAPNHHGGVPRRRKCLSVICGHEWTSIELSYNAMTGRGKGPDALRRALDIKLADELAAEILASEGGDGKGLRVDVSQGTS